VSKHLKAFLFVNFFKLFLVSLLDSNVFKYDSKINIEYFCFSQKGSLSYLRQENVNGFMKTVGEKIAEIRKSKGMSQRDLSKIINKAFSVIGKYERNEINPSIEILREFAKALDVSLLYLVDNTNEADLLKDKEMIKRLTEIKNVPNEDRERILYTFDVMLRDAKARMAYS
jgi:transcriptional regulator with XRE-family HTH domain